MTIWPGGVDDPAGAERGEAARRADRGDMLAATPISAGSGPEGRTASAARDRRCRACEASSIDGDVSWTARDPSRRGRGEGEGARISSRGMSCTIKTRRLRWSSSGQSSSHSGANIACCAACTTAGRSGRSAKRTMPLTRSRSLPRSLRQPAERAGEIEAADLAVEDHAEGVDAVGVGARLGSGRAWRGSSVSLPRGVAEQHRAGVAAAAAARMRSAPVVERVEAARRARRRAGRDRSW